MRKRKRNQMLAAPEPEQALRVRNQLGEVENTQGAVDLFGAMLRGVRAAKARREERERNGSPQNDARP